MCKTKLRTASPKTINKVLDIIYLLVRALTVKADMYFSAFFSRLSILYILYIFPIRQSYIAANMK